MLGGPGCIYKRYGKDSCTVVALNDIIPQSRLPRNLQKNQGVREEKIIVAKHGHGNDLNKFK